VARAVPDDRLLVETDAPFLAPVPYRGRRNEPAWVAATLEALAACRGVPVEVMAATVARNFDALFRVR
jgi:TatD DNase family protein